MPRPTAGARNLSVIRRAQGDLDALLFLSIPTPIGRMRLAASPTGLVRVELPGSEAEARMSIWLALHFPHAVRRGGVSPVLRKAAQQMEAYFTGNLRAFSLPVEVSGTPFQIAVWKLVAEIPFGATRSYGAIARALGNPNAVRAVAAAHGANPVPIVVPCHRVIGSKGALIGYVGGLATKRWLLDHERERAPVATPAAEPKSPQLNLFVDGSARPRRPWPSSPRPTRLRPRVS
jgi:methylated-DNA-[protein]-cysteine S-methyltransferase